MLKVALSVIAVVVLGTAAYGYSFARDIAAVAGGYVSQTVCANVLILGRDLADVQAQDLSYDQKRFTTSAVNGRQVDTTVRLGPLSFVHTSVHRPGLGCAPIAGRSLEEVENIGLDEPLGASNAGDAWPQVASDLPHVDMKQLEATVDAAFTETSDDIYQKKNTRAVLVHYRGQLITERYAGGFDGDTPLRSMSMTKSVTATLVGILAGQEKLDIHEPAPVRGWAELDDARSRVTTDHLLTMTAGFDYREAAESDPTNLLSTMLYAVPDAPALAAQTPLRGEPGVSWEYQTVHSVLLQDVIRNTIGDDQAYFRFPRQALFDRLGMRHSFFQADASGTFIGGASLFASGRDWIKLGLLYLNDGVAATGPGKGERILPEGWVAYATTPSGPSSETRAYGAQIWLNTQSPRQLFPGAPADAYAFQGHYGQYVIVVPSLELVVVRMGMTFDEGGGSFDKQAFLQGILAALPDAAPVS
jgi:CubicO group peptidase (beta-lactamase class C family)